MSIKHAILGFLSWTPFTGYELKKLFAESATLHWSGNSNQIYKALIELHKENMVSLEIQHQDAHPSRKVYSITEKGQFALKSWVLSAPEPPVLRSSFLIQLAWADQLGSAELDALLEKYEEELRAQLSMFSAQERRNAAPRRTPRETYLWSMIAENWISFYEADLDWVRRLRTGLAELQTGQEKIS
jgi:DNA-binding PadR family transcriptional regulator